MSIEAQSSHVHTLGNGADIEYFIDDEAPTESGLLIYHHGTPAAGPLLRDLILAARASNLQAVELVRPGYGSSTRQPGRSIADIVPSVLELADHLGHEEFVTLGWSGGGPHAIATLALASGRCRAAMSLAGVAPYDAPGLTFLDGMGQENIDEFGAALAGIDELAEYLGAQREDLRAITGPDVISALASLLPDVDCTFLTGERGREMAASLRWSVAQGIWGWFDDDVAFTQPWGFDLAAIDLPLSIYQGTADLMVPPAHGHWLASAIPAAHSVIADGHGHLSMASECLVSGIADLREGLDR
jgi:pimeloyl-ACP methyl ester carboxylesterase